MNQGSLTEKLAVYSMAAGGTMFAGQAVGTTPGLPVVLNGENFDSFNVDVDGDGSFDYTINTETRDVNGFTYFCAYITTYGTSTESNYVLADFAVGDGYIAANVPPGVPVAAGDDDFELTNGYITYCSTNGEQGNFGRGLVYLLFAEGGPFVKNADGEAAKGDPNYVLGFLDITREDTLLRIAGGDSTPVESESTELVGRLTNFTIPVGGAIPIAIGVFAMGAAALRRRRKDNI